MATDALALVEGLLEYCGIDSDGFREEGRLLLTVDSDLVVFVVVEDSLVHFSTVLDEAPQRQDLYLRLLTENFKNVTNPGYYHYALEPESQALIIGLSINAAGLEQSRFIDYFKLFLEQSEKWGRALHLTGVDFATWEGEDSAPAPEPAEAQPQYSPDDPFARA